MLAYIIYECNTVVDTKSIKLVLSFDISLTSLHLNKKMSSFIFYGGVRYKLERHAMFCKKCNQTIVSLFVHDYKQCSCGSVSVDGGPFEGNHITIHRGSDVESRSVYSAIIKNKKIWLPNFIVQQHFKF
jgi:hypothetical protein